MPPKPPWFYRQSAVIPVYRGRVVMVTTRKGKRWTVPKGIIEKGMGAAESALKEAGLEGEAVGDELGSYRYEKWGGTCTVRVYLMHVASMAEEWPESHFRKRRLFTREECLAAVRDEGLRDIIAGVDLGLVSTDKAETEGRAPTMD